jgi:hypothetical protein
MEYSVIELDVKTDEILDVLLVTEDKDIADDTAAIESIGSKSKFEVRNNANKRQEVIELTY